MAFMVACFVLLLQLQRSISAIPAYFILGDSLADPGNNNYLLTLAKSNFPPYGMQFDTSLPTGRFSNGRTTLDYLGSFLGLPLIPAYLDPSTRGIRLLKGVNFASAGAGIIDSTGNIFGEVIPLSVQVQQFNKVQQEISKLIGPAPASELISASLLTVLIGSNDYINNYLFKVSKESKLSPSDFQDLLVTTYISHAQKLLSMGVRKLHLINIPPIGCIPRSLALYGSRTGECIEAVNNLAQGYNRAFKEAVSALRDSNTQAQIILSDAYKFVTNLIQNPGAYGFTSASTACCGLGRFNGGVTCLPDAHICSDVDKREFFDSFHTTDRANRIIATSLFSGSDNEPFNISHL